MQLSEKGNNWCLPIEGLVTPMKPVGPFQGRWDGRIDRETMALGFLSH